jgi:hypothetical protein
VYALPKLKDKSVRVGVTNYNKHGSLMKVVSYNHAKDVWVEFIEHGVIVNVTWEQFCRGGVKNPYDRSVYGVGYVGEGKYKATINCEQTKQYSVWVSMLSRCYNEKLHNRQPAYKDCTVCKEWHNFQTFAAWFDENYYEVNEQRVHLDKDILVKGNKIYSPETCLFVPQNINCLFTKSDRSRGKLPVGVNFNKINKKYQASCNDGTGFQIKLSLHYTPEEAFIVYKNFKENLIKKVANEYRGIIPKSLYEAMLLYEVCIND